MDPEDRGPERPREPLLTANQEVNLLRQAISRTPFNSIAAATLRLGASVTSSLEFIWRLGSRTASRAAAYLLPALVRRSRWIVVAFIAAMAVGAVAALFVPGADTALTRRVLSAGVTVMASGVSLTALVWIGRAWGGLSDPQPFVASDGECGPVRGLEFLHGRPTDAQTAHRAVDPDTVRTRSRDPCRRDREKSDLGHVAEARALAGLAGHRLYDRGCRPQPATARASDPCLGTPFGR